MTDAEEDEFFFRVSAEDEALAAGGGWQSEPEEHMPEDMTPNADEGVPALMTPEEVDRQEGRATSLADVRAAVLTAAEAGTQAPQSPARQTARAPWGEGPPGTPKAVLVPVDAILAMQLEAAGAMVDMAMQPGTTTSEDAEGAMPDEKAQESDQWGAALRDTASEHDRWGEALDSEAAGRDEDTGPEVAAGPQAFQPIAKAVGHEHELRVAVWNAGNLHGGLGGIDVRAAATIADADARTKAKDKMAFLCDAISASEPDVLFLLEVSGSNLTCQALRAGLAYRGYNFRLFYFGGTNGIVGAVRNSTCRLVESKVVAKRVAGLVVESKVDGRVRRFAGIHGINTESPPEAFDADDNVVAVCHAEQVASIQAWLGDGGVAIGDWNRVCCKTWRCQAGAHGASRRAITDDDRRVRDLGGFGCECCGPCESDVRVCTVVDPFNTEATRWDTRTPATGVDGARPQRIYVRPTARIDYAIATGSEALAWSTRHSVRAEKTHVTNGVVVSVPLSDHHFYCIARPVRAANDDAERRPLPIQIGRKASEAVQKQYRESVGEGSDVGGRIEQATREAKACGGAASGAAAAILVAKGQQVTTEARAKIHEARQRSIGKRAAETPVKRLEQWLGRLREVLRLQACGYDPWASNYGLFSKRAGLRKYRSRKLDDGAVWEGVIRRCRREIRRAQVAAREQRDTEDARLFELCASMTAPHVSAVVRMQQAWRAIREKSGSLAMGRIWKGDVAPTAAEIKAGRHDKKCMAHTEPEFLSELGAIGEKFVEKTLASTPACELAFEAWADLVMQAFRPLQGLDDTDFVLARELTYKVFLEALANMPKGKAVGAGGFSVELLQAASDEGKKAFYEALMQDVRDRKVDATWKQVLYVLLEKPKPNNPEVVSERREIALMAQEMKLLLKMVRDVSYQRVLGRVISAQAGWLTGFGCTDPALVAAALIQQQRRLQRPLYLLYIDLSTFFPKLDRQVVRYAEMIHGLPEEVSDLVALIYGEATNRDDCVECRYDSEAGLGDPFKNYMGALMGCVLSPDRAKLVLNTVVAAISLHCKGVRVAGYGVDELRDTWVRIEQVMFADDHLGLHESVPDLRDAWEVWSTWAPISGCKLGVKVNLKTAVTGVHWEGGRPTSVPDPCLRLPGGGQVPYMRHDEAYKHLGIMRRADGSDACAWKALVRKFDAAIGRLKRLRQPTVQEFMMVSDALLGGLAGYYLQTVYISWQQAEVVERKWRRLFRAKFGKRLGITQSTPRAYYYDEAGHFERAHGKAGRTRQHIYAIGLSSLAACVGNAIADVSDTPQRTAARSMVACAMERWGCRQDPARWDWRHVVEAVETKLRKAQCKELGDAWLLATALLEGQHREHWAISEDAASKWTRDFGSECQQKWGRWQGAFPEHDALNSEARRWQKPSSALMFEPTGNGGLGMELEPLLLEAGVAAVGNMTREVAGDNGEVTYRWLDFRAARRENARIPNHGVVANAWTRQLARLEQLGVQPCRPEAVLAADGLGGKATGRLAQTMQNAERGSSGTAPAARHANASEIRSMLADPAVRAGCDKRTWGQRLRAAFPKFQPRAAVEWAHGGRCREREAHGAHVVTVLDAERTVQTRGGQARWLARARADYSPRAEDEAVIGALGTDGCLQGWQERERAILESVHIDDEGYLCAASDGHRIAETECPSLEPALQAMVRARCALAAWYPEVERLTSEELDRVMLNEKQEGGKNKPCGADGDAKDDERGDGKDDKAPAKLLVIDRWPAPKLKRCHVNLATMREDLNEYVRMQVKYGATAFYAVDGSRDVYQPSEGVWEYVITRAYARHCGSVAGSRLHEPEGADNYLAELAAQMDVASAEAAGGRIVVVFDATSPVQAMLRFRKICDRWRQGRFVGAWLDQLITAMDRHEVVVLLWRRSHTGSPFNEWADVLASEAKGAPAVPVPRQALTFASANTTMNRKSIQMWAAPLARKEVRRRLAATLTQALVREESDMPMVALTDAEWAVCHAVRGQRSCMGDERRHRGGVAADEFKRMGCPFGCVRKDGGAAAFTWLHAQIFCKHEKLVAAREPWAAATGALQETLFIPNSPDHDQLAAVEGIMKKARGQTRGSGPTPEVALPSYLERHLRRYVGGLVGTSGQPKMDRSKAVTAALRTAVQTGAAVQLMAQELTKEYEDAVYEPIKRAKRLAKHVRKWRVNTRESGPARIAALREVSVSKTVVTCAIGRLEAAGQLDDELAKLQRAELSRRTATACKAARMLYPRRGAAAYADWHHLALLSTWRLHTMRKRRPDESGREVDTSLDTVRTEAAVATAWLQDITGLQAHIAFGVPQAAPRVGREHEPGGRGVFATCEEAWQRWQAGGGRRGEDKRAATEKTKARRRWIVLAANRMKRYFRAGNEHTGEGLSGAIVPRFHRRHTWLAVDSGKRRRISKDPAKAQRKREALREERQIAAGAAADARGFWIVDEILEVQRVKTPGAKGVPPLWANIRWRGAPSHGDQAGVPWRTEWCRVTKDGDRGLNDACYQACREMAARILGPYKPAAPTPRPAGAKRTPRLAEADGEDDEAPPPPRRRRKTHVLSESESGGETEDESDDATGGGGAAAGGGFGSWVASRARWAAGILGIGGRRYDRRA